MGQNAECAVKMVFGCLFICANGTLKYTLPGVVDATDAYTYNYDALTSL